MKKNNKKIILIGLLSLAIFMGIGYSLLQQQLKIEGTATVKTGFDVRITGIERYNNAGTNINPEVSNAWVALSQNAIELSEPTFTATTATFNVRLEEEASITYLVTIENKGNIPAVFDPVVIEQTGNTDVEVETLVNLDNRFLDTRESVSYLVTLNHVTYNGSNEPTSAVTVTFNAKQYTDGNEERVAPTILFNYDPYTPGADFYLIDVLNKNDAIGVIPNVYEAIDGGELPILVEQGVTVQSESIGNCYFSDDGSILHYLPPMDLTPGLHTIKLFIRYPDGSGTSNTITLKHYVAE